MRALIGIVVALGLLALPASTSGQHPVARAAATCSDYSTQAAAQRAADTRDADGDGIYCESLPCPCLGPGTAPAPAPTPAPPVPPEPTPHPAAPEPTPTEPELGDTFSARITAVVDGDTIKVRASATQAAHTVRLIGIDTPETRKPRTPIECGAKQATSAMLRLAFTRPRDTDRDRLFDRAGGTGRAVTVSTDPSQDRTDRYRRLLAYVKTSAGKNLATQQLTAGWASVYVYDGRPFAQVAAFRAAEKRARDAQRGVWRSCGGDFHTPAF